MTKSTLRKVQNLCKHAYMSLHEHQSMIDDDDDDSVCRLKVIHSGVVMCVFEGMLSNDQHRPPLDDDRRRLARVLPGSSVYRPLHWAVQSPPTNGVLPARADTDVTSGSRDELAPPPAKLPRQHVPDQLLPPTAGPGKYQGHVASAVAITTTSWLYCCNIT